MVGGEAVRELAAAAITNALAQLPEADAAAFGAFAGRMVSAIVDTLPFCRHQSIAFQGRDFLIYGPQSAFGQDIDDTLVTVVVNKAGTTRTITDYATGRIVSF